MVFPFFRTRRAASAEKQRQLPTDGSAPLPETGEARLNRVEKEQYRLRLTLWRAIFFAGGTVLLSQLLALSLFSRGEKGRLDSELEKKLEGRFLSLYAEQLWLRPKPGTPSLVQLDRNGVGRLVLRADEEGGPSLQFRDHRGALRVGITSAENDGPQIALLDDMQKTRARLTLTSEGHPSLTLCDEAERARALLTIENQRPCLLLLDESLNPISVGPHR